MKTLLTVLTLMMLTACGCKTPPEPVGIVYPPKRSAVKQAVPVPGPGTTTADLEHPALPPPSLPTSTIVIIQTAPGEWEWQITSGNNVLLETSHRTFGSPSAALAHYKATREAMAEQPAPFIIRDLTLAPEAP